MDYKTHNYLLDNTPCLQSNNIYKSAATLRNRVKNILHNASYIGNSKSAPTEFLLVYGVIESILYSLRLYGCVVDTYTSDSSTQGDILAMIRDVEEHLSYDADKLVRNLGRFSSHLDEAEDIVRAVTSQGCVGLTTSEQITSTRYTKDQLRCLVTSPVLISCLFYVSQICARDYPLVHFSTDGDISCRGDAV